MDEGNVVPICFAIPLAICLVLREIWWRKRLKTWVKSEGEVIGYSQPPEQDSSCPIVAYKFGGQEREQICEFNLCNYKIGEIVPIVINPSSGEIFVATYQDRWFLSVFLIGCVILLLILSYASNSPH
jgi:hypothetical protein